MQITIPSIMIAKQDYQRLMALVERTESETATLLEQELDRASIVVDVELPSDVVAMNCRVKFLDVETSKESVVTLVYPHEANIEAGRISILAPVGAALIGLKVGQSIQWPLPNGKEKTLKVVEVLKERGEEQKS